jgi:hypothetical protein
MTAAELLHHLAANPIIPIGATFTVGLLAWAVVALVTSSKGWHDRRHSEGLRALSCDHCFRQWRAQIGAPRG